MILIYLILVLTLFAIGFNNRNQILHATYCRWFYEAPYWILEKSGMKMKHNRSLAILYAGADPVKIRKLHLSLKISSCLLFGVLSAMTLTISRNTGVLELFLSVLFLFLGYYLPEIDLRIKQKKLSEQILVDFSRFCYHLSLYVNSGLTVYQSFKKSVLKERISIFHENAGMVIKKSEGGNVFLNELLAFSERMSCNEINSLVSLLCQNLKNGGEIKHKLNEFSEQMWVKRKNLVLKKGEKASVNMVFPLTLGLIGVILILVTPAIMLIKQI